MFISMMTVGLSNDRTLDCCWICLAQNCSIFTWLRESQQKHTHPFFILRNWLELRAQNRSSRETKNQYSYLADFIHHLLFVLPVSLFVWARTRFVLHRTLFWAIVLRGMFEIEGQGQQHHCKICTYVARTCILKRFNATQIQTLLKRMKGNNNKSTKQKLA